eukprot:4918827-Lingulodinium_polyedra.AAC.1
MWMCPNLAHAAAPPVRLWQGGRQGGPCTPLAWNYHIDGAVQAAMADAALAGPALSWAEALEPFSVLVWADNVYLVADSRETAQFRVGCLEQRFDELGLRFSAESLEVLGNSF